MSNVKVSVDHIVFVPFQFPLLNDPSWILMSLFYDRGAHCCQEKSTFFILPLSGKPGKMQCNRYWDGPLNWNKGCCSNIAFLLRML